MNPGPAGPAIFPRSQLKPALLPPTCLRRSLARARRSRARWRPRGATRCRQRDPGLASPGSRGRGRPPRQTLSGARACTPAPTRPPRSGAARVDAERRELESPHSGGSAPWLRRAPALACKTTADLPTLIPGRKIHRHAGLSQNGYGPRIRGTVVCIPACLRTLHRCSSANPQQLRSSTDP